MFGQRPSFGVSSSFGGFGTNTSSTGFGSSSTFGRPAFGTPQTTASTTPFGSGSSTGTSLFGQTQQPSGGGLFGSQSTGFGTTSSGFGSGGGLFGSSAPQTSTSGLGGLFGSTTSTSGFNPNQNQTRPFSFGTPTTSSSGTGTSLFGTSNATSGTNLFSSSIGQTPGTVVKFNPVTSTDTMFQSGVSQAIQTKIEVITAMKEYETRSLEELRVEDYLAGRKGPQQQQQQGFAFGAMGQQNKFMSQPATSSNWLSQSNTGGGIFGAKPQETKPLFGTGQSTGFGTSTASGGGLFGSTTQSPFGQATTAPSSGFSFGQNQSKPAGFSFGQTTSTPSLFGSNTATQSGSTFGSMGFNFSGQNTQQGGLFGSQNKPAFGSSTSTSTNLFSNKPAGTFGGFGSTTATASPFGATSTSTAGGLFGNLGTQKPGFAMGTSTTGFGSTAPGFGGGGSIFGSTPNQPFGQSVFGTNPSPAGMGINQPNTGGSLFSGTFGNTGTGLNLGSTLGTNPGFGVNPMANNANMNASNVVSDNINNLIKALTHNPFGTSSLLKNAAAPTGKADELLNSPTSTSASNANPSKTVSDKTPTYVLPSGSTKASKPKPFSLNRSANLSEESKKNLLFAGLDDKGENFDDPFKMKTFPSVKKLNLKVFKNSKNNNSEKNIGTGQSSASNSLTNDALLTAATSPSSINLPTSPGILDSPTIAGSPSPLHGNSPTPDIIKGRNSMKHLKMSDKIPINDTLVDLNVGTREPGGAGRNPLVVDTIDLDTSEANKENNISIYDRSCLSDVPDNANDSVVSSPHPAGIKLARSGYYTIPSMEDLAEMVDQDGCCLVDNFTIGRYGYGNICYPGITNVAGLDLDTCIVIVRKEVEVYPQGIRKPPVGEELNKPALVTLDCVWPIDKCSHEVIKCQERLDAMCWPQYLEKQCLKMGATFVEFRVETGSWVFKVKHFSKYGLQEEENEPPGAQALQTGMEPPGTNLLPPAKDMPPTSTMEGPQKTPLALSNFQTSLPLFGARGPPTTQGPPNFSFTSPPPHVEAHMGTPEATAASLKKKMFLDGSTLDMEEDSFSISAREAACIRPLSPSAERLTLSSRAPPRAIQTLKSQLFFGDMDIEENEGERSISTFNFPREKGEKRGFFLGEDAADLPPGGGDADDADVSTRAIITAEGLSKRLLLGKEPKFETVAYEDVAKASFIQKETTVTEKTKAAYSPTFLEIQAEEPQMIVDKSFLRDPRTEYHLLDSASDPYFDLGKESTSHLGESVPWNESLASQIPKGIADSAAFMGRSFRVGWGPSLTLVHAGHPVGYSLDVQQDNETEQRREESPSARQYYLFGGEFGVGPKSSIVLKAAKTERRKVCLEKIHLKTEVNLDGKEQVDPELESYLQNVLECSNLMLTAPITSPETNEVTTMEISDAVRHEPSSSSSTTSLVSIDRIFCPRFTPHKGINLLHRLALTAAQAESSDEHHFRSKLPSASPIIVFDLCVALWGRLDFYSPEADGESEYALMQARKEALSVWLEEVSQDTVAMETERALLNDSQESYLDAVVAHLTARQISKACEICQSKGDHHLALLLSQACLGDETPRHIMKEQLSNWAWAGSDALMSASRLTLYSLVAGKATHDSSQGMINTCLGLDWRRCFAILMWYVCPTTASISEIMKEYESAAGLSGSKDDTYCEEPKPPYLSTEELPANIKVNYDVCFQLLKLFVDRSHPLDTLLETSAHTPDPVDVTMSWLLWCILQSLDYNLLSNAKAEALHTSMAAYLESVGSWQWAAFVILSINDERKRKSDLLELLSRQLLVEGEDGCSDPFYKEKELFILKELRVPEQWLHKAKAIRAKSLHLVDEEAWYLIQAGDYNEAHVMIVEHIAPNAVVNEDHQHLMTYLTEFDGDVMQSVTNWENGGGIYLAYLEVIEQVNELKESRQPTASKVEKLRPRLMALCLRLNNLKCVTAVQKLCISEMSRMVVSVLRAILSDDPEGIRVLSQQVTSLPLTHECALEELNHITHQFLTTLSHTDMDTSAVS